MDDIDRIPKEIFSELNLEIGDRLHNFFVKAGKKNIYDEIPGWSNVISMILSAKIIERSLTQHAEALTRSAQASEKHARSMVFVTWVLVAATVLLAIITALSIIN